MKEELYHYSTFDKFINGITKTKSIRLGSILNVNDPLDYKDRIYRNSQLFKKGDAKNSLELRDSYKTTLNTKWIKNCKVACFSVSQNDTNLKGYQLANLWSYYADNHNGVCVVLDKEKVIAFFEKNFTAFNPLHEKVNYKEKLGHFLYNTKYNTNERQGIIDNKAPLFFEKLKSWDREQEYRLICFSKNEFEYIPLQGMIEEIILGQKISNENQEILKNLYPTIKISKMYYFGGDGKFEKIEIDNELWAQKASIGNN